MISKMLEFFGYKIIYKCDWGIYSNRYDGIDHTMCRPIHKDMSCAPPWAKQRIVKINDN